ncbi:hypothetical protein C7Y72_06720 [Paraconexibacter algicola]|uniref:MmyB-like transcription regulator ligand binding domain-containing protein n=1 Tax=Paraconexibacter algicola TaxID=2133960 RepID=A0A2T4UJF5_9ACTN|nr:hypothetical protein C7Y72_06720 [Paraconexibacter algicola]
MGRHPGDPELAALIGELSMKSPEFADWWPEHEVLRRSHGTKRYHHPVIGDLTVSYEALAVPDDQDQTLFVYSTEPGSPSAAALELLASWTADPAVR